MVEKKIRQNLFFLSSTVISWHLRCILKKSERHVLSGYEVRNAFLFSFLFLELWKE